jgi:hypothetical protein
MGSVIDSGVSGRIRFMPRHGLIEAERIADRYDFLADTDLVRIAKRQGRQRALARPGNADQCKIENRVGAHEPGNYGSAIIQHYGKGLPAEYDMGIRQDRSVGIQDESGAECAGDTAFDPVGIDGLSGNHHDRGRSFLEQFGNRRCAPRLRTRGASGRVQEDTGEGGGHCECAAAGNFSA